MWITSKDKKGFTTSDCVSRSKCPIRRRSRHFEEQSRPDARRAGFTLIELLVVIAIIGILTVVTVVSLTAARRRARDTRRIADIQQIRSALLIYANARAVFPDVPVGEVLVLGGENAKCLDDNGFHDVSACRGTKIMERVPAEQSSDPAFARYTYARGASNYIIRFQLEGPVGDLNVETGICTADENTITCT